MEKSKSTKKRRQPKRAAPRARAVGLGAEAAPAPAGAEESSPAQATPVPVAPPADVITAEVVTAEAVRAEAAPTVAPVAAAPELMDSIVELEASFGIKDVESAHQRIAAAFDRGCDVKVDLSRVATADTAGVQLLLAARNEAAQRGVSVVYVGESAALTQALTVLGLRDLFGAASSRD